MKYGKWMHWAKCFPLRWMYFQLFNIYKGSIVLSNVCEWICQGQLISVVMSLTQGGEVFSVVKRNVVAWGKKVSLLWILEILEGQNLFQLWPLEASWHAVSPLLLLQTHCKAHALHCSAKASPKDFSLFDINVLFTVIITHGPSFRVNSGFCLLLLQLHCRIHFNAPAYWELGGQIFSIFRTWLISCVRHILTAFFILNWSSNRCWYH